MKKSIILFIFVCLCSPCKGEDYDTYFVGYEREYIIKERAYLRKVFYIAYKDDGFWYEFGRYDQNDYSLISVSIDPPGYVKNFYGKWHPTRKNTLNYDAIAYQKKKLNRKKN
jgi:hypothetical protein